MCIGTPVATLLSYTYIHAFRVVFLIHPRVREHTLRALPMYTRVYIFGCSELTCVERVRRVRETTHSSLFKMVIGLLFRFNGQRSDVRSPPLRIMTARSPERPSAAPKIFTESRTVQGFTGSKNWNAIVSRLKLRSAEDSSSDFQICCHL